VDYQHLKLLCIICKVERKAQKSHVSTSTKGYYTPKKASWLNMQEIEFSAIARRCLNRRIATKVEIAREVGAIVKEREEKAIKIEWQFSIERARTKLNRHYEQVHAENKKYKTT